jgi:hypothetical protein
MWSVDQPQGMETLVVYNNIPYRQDLIAEFLNRIGAYVDEDGRISA